MVNQTQTLQESASVFYIGENQEMELLADTVKTKLRLNLNFENFKTLEEFLSHLKDSANLKPLSIFLNPNIPFFKEQDFNNFILSHPVLKFAPLFLVINSQEDRTKFNLKNNGIRSYLTKPFNPRLTTELLRSASIYWENLGRDSDMLTP